MIQSALRYLSMTKQVLLNKRIRALVLNKPTTTIPSDRSSAVALSKWLLLSQNEKIDGGYRTYYLDKKWTSSYPETTGYIIPVLVEAAKKLGLPELEKSALIAAEWLLTIQKEEGGWQGGYIHQNRPAIVFNTGQVIRGLIAMYKHTKDDRFFQSAIKAGDWLVSIQHSDGYWEEYVYLNRIRVYDTYVAAPLAQLYQLTSDLKYKTAAIAQCEWVIHKKQQQNGWFQDADNTIKHNDRPILHTIAYTIDGLLETGIILNRTDFIDAAIIPAKILAEKWINNKALNGRYNSNWSGSEAFITTGGAQMAIAFMRLYEIEANSYWLDRTRELLEFLKSIQIMDTEILDVKGAIFGSHPSWGHYEAFGIPNWANKYFLEALLMTMPRA
jgi:rhamnogalacturonyl hydrolase YesR